MTRHIAYVGIPMGQADRGNEECPVGLTRAVLRERSSSVSTQNEEVIVIIRYVTDESHISS